MRLIRSVTASVLFVLFISNGSLVAAGAGARGLTEGTFIGIEPGDPAHFLINKQGEIELKTSGFDKTEKLNSEINRLLAAN